MLQCCRSTLPLSPDATAGCRQAERPRSSEAEPKADRIADKFVFGLGLVRFDQVVPVDQRLGWGAIELQLLNSRLLSGRISSEALGLDHRKPRSNRKGLLFGVTAWKRNREDERLGA
jgi:hypothetical protein